MGIDDSDVGAASFGGGDHVGCAAGAFGGLAVPDGKHDHVPEQAFHMVGGIDSVLEKAERIARQAA